MSAIPIEDKSPLNAWVEGDYKRSLIAEADSKNISMGAQLRIILKERYAKNPKKDGQKLSD